MTTRKLKTFEYAYKSQKYSGTEQIRETVGAYDTANGFALVFCSGYSNEEKDAVAAEIALERVSYYLDNDFVDNPAEAVVNALVYASGFIHEYGCKNPEYEGMKTACLCVLIRDNKVYYSNVGDSALYFFNGKRLYPLALNADFDDAGENVLLGSDKIITPNACEYPFVPVDNDTLMICSERYLTSAPEKTIKSILSDPMPLLTKVSRLVDVETQISGKENVSIQLVSFYNIDNDERHFSPIKNKSAASKVDEFKIPRIIKHPIGNLVIIGLILLFFMYMVYDLFIYNPRPAINIQNAKDETEQVDDLQSAEEVAEEEKYVIPEDTVYPVKSGDTWGRIYQKFGVCSWFIKNHKPNIGKFDRSDNPVAGTRISIPLTYSSKKEFNPDFYIEFSTEKIGSSCQNANADFVKAFEKKRDDMN